ncbi:MAG TPA: cytochrome c oxidase subunit II [Pirellulales bacterium]|jgi:cytochrome c oxidase subunit 2|nr:cytochrome c oxidase subunit II [Pirellulales bacterium]
MLAQLQLFPDQASTSAVHVDRLLVFLLCVTGFFALLIVTLVIVFAVKYRRRSGTATTPRIKGSTKLEVFWSVVPLALAMIMFVWGADVYFRLARPPDSTQDVYVVGKQWMWKIQHLGGQREINELHVPLGVPIKLTLTSEDVIHDFFVPAFRTKVDVLPGRYVHTWFQATKTGRFHLYCSQYCGTNHSGMIGTVVVADPAEYQAWLKDRAEGSLALEGRKLFLYYRCVTCHSADAQARAPVLENLYGRQVPLNDGRTVTADDTYLRESILSPDAKIVAGYQPIMPTFQGQISEDDLIKLIEFIKALGLGETPPRIDSAMPPVAQPPAAQPPAAAPVVPPAPGSNP